MIQPTLHNLHPNKYSLEFHYFTITNKTEDLNLSVFNMITEINESKNLIKDISCECKCRFDGKKT